MYYLKKEVTFSAAHCLDHLDYDSPCREQHGHNWKVTVYCKGETLNKNGMLVDFKDIKEAIQRKYDHINLNTVMDAPTAERLAYHISFLIPFCYRVDIEESEGSIVSYEEEESQG